MADEHQRELERRAATGSTQDEEAYLRELQRSGDHVAWLAAARKAGITYDYGEELLQPTPVRILSEEEALAVLANPATNGLRAFDDYEKLDVLGWIGSLFRHGS